MENMKFWLFLIVFTVLALSIRYFGFDGASFEHTKERFHAIRAEFVHDDDTTADANSAVNSSPKPFRPHFVQPKPQIVAAAEPLATPPPAPPAKPEVKAEEKKDEKKKKKKKKKVIKADDAKKTEDAANKKSGDDSKAAAAGPVDQPGSPGVFGGVTAKTDAKTNPAQFTIKDWENFLLDKPDFKETSWFLSLYESHVITANTFYTIVQEMMADARLNMRLLGVMCLGATPSLNSFEMLAQWYSTEPPGTPVKRNMDGYLSAYARVENLSVLEQAMHVTNSNNASLIQIQALRITQNSIQQYLKPLLTAPASNNGGTGQLQSLAVTTARAHHYYDPMSAVLSQIATTSSNAVVKALASQALSTIQTSFSTSYASASGI